MKPFLIIYFWLILAGIGVGLFHFSKLSQSSRISVALLVVTLISEAVAQLLKVKMSNFPVYHFFIPIQFFLITISYNAELRSKYLLTIFYAFLAFSVIATFTFQPLKIFPSYTNLISSFLVIVWSLMFLRALLKQTSEYSFTQFPLFWISCGWLMFNILTLFHFGTYNYLLTVKNPVFQSVFRNVRIGANYFLYGCYIISFLTSQRQIEQHN